MATSAFNNDFLKSFSFHCVTIWAAVVRNVVVLVLYTSAVGYVVIKCVSQ